MAWRNILQQPSWIPQSLATDPDTFMSHIQNATTTTLKEQALNDGNLVFNGTPVTNYQHNVIIAGDSYYNMWCEQNPNASTGTRIWEYQNGSPVTYHAWRQSFYHTDSDRKVSFVACVNDDTQQGFFLVINTYRDGNISSVGGSSFPVSDSDILTKMYTLLTGNPYIPHNWMSVPAISGKDGVHSLATINNADIGDGSSVSDADYSVINSLAESAKLRNFWRNCANGETRDIMYSGDAFKCTMEVAATTVTLKFYFRQTTPIAPPTAFYSYTVNRYNLDVNSQQYIGFIIDEDNQQAALNIIYVKVNPNTYVKTVDYCNPGVSMTPQQMADMYTWIKGSFTDLDTLDSFVDNDGDGGGTLIDRVNNPIPKPGVPTLSAFDTGFITQYKIDKQQLNDLAEFLWSEDFINTIKKFFNDPMEILIGLKIFPLVPKQLGLSKEIRGGGVATGVQGLPLIAQFDEYDFGSVIIEKRLKSEDDSNDSGIYFDYAPYTSINVYLPFCGEHSLDPNDVMGKSLHLYYKVDFLSGVCVASLVIEDPDDSSVPDECHYNFAGQMGVDCPISQADYREKMSALISCGIMAGTAIATIKTGGFTAPLGKAAAKAAGVPEGTRVTDNASVVHFASHGASQLANNVANMHPEVQHTSGGGEVSGTLSSEYPYITISEPDIFDAKNQKHYKGYPINGTYTIGSFSGFVQIEGVHLDGLSCTERERNAIRDALEAGVIVNKTNPSSKPDASAPAGEFGVVFIKNLSDPDTIGKHWVTTTKVTGKLLYNQDIDNIKLQVDGNYSAYNYCYIGAFDRFYFIDTFHIDTGTLMTIEMSCDPLQSYKDEILALEALVSSAEDLDKAHLLVNNGYWYMKQKKTIKTLTFKKEGSTQFFDRSSTGTECFLLTIAGDCVPYVDPTPPD